MHNAPNSWCVWLRPHPLRYHRFAGADQLNQIHAENNDGASPTRRQRKKSLVTYGEANARSAIQASLEVDQLEKDMVCFGVLGEQLRYKQTNKGQKGHKYCMGDQAVASYTACLLLHLRCQAS